METIVTGVAIIAGLALSLITLAWFTLLPAIGALYLLGMLK